MKKKQARKLVPGDQLVMVRDGSYNAAFKSGDRVSFAQNEGGQRIEVLGLRKGREIPQTVDRKDVELYKPTPCEALGYKVGDLFLVGYIKDAIFEAGSIIELAKDDGTDLPEFKLVTGTCNSCINPYGYFPLSLVTPYTELPHADLRSTYREGQQWEFKGSQSPDWKDCGGMPSWFAQHEYRLKPETTKPQTRREQLIEAGVPAEELAKVVDARLDVEATMPAAKTISYTFAWSDSPQGHDYWWRWEDKLNGKDVTIPEPLDAAPQLYCVVFGDDNRMCSINGSEVAHTAGTFDACNNTAKSMRRLFPDNTYRVMRLVPDYGPIKFVEIGAAASAAAAGYELLEFVEIGVKAKGKTTHEATRDPDEPMHTETPA